MNDNVPSGFGVSTADSAILSPLLGDAEVAQLFNDQACVAAMARFEIALAGAQAEHGVIPSDAAAQIQARASSFEGHLAAMGQSTADASVPTIELVNQMRYQINHPASAYLHWGATSQDVVDTGLVLRLAQVLDLLEERLRDLIGSLSRQADAHRRTVMPARTRYQQALPTSLGLKLASWLAPLPRQLERLQQLRPRVLCVQLGGAVGTLSALGNSGIAVMESVAKRLCLESPPMHWHSQRDGILEVAGWACTLTGVLGKLAQDVALHQQSEIGELRESTNPARGGSSTMPQKANPIGAEATVALARFNAGMLGTLHQAAIQENERGGPGWQLEWMTLPQIMVATGAALRHSLAFAKDMSVNAERMQENLGGSNGLIMAEAVSFALAAHMPRPDAQALVKEACRFALSSDEQLIDVVKTMTDAPVDWAHVADPLNYLGVADQFIDRVLATCDAAVRETDEAEEP